MPFSLDHDLLRTAHPSQAGPYLHKIAATEEFDTALVSQELLHAVAIESLPPRVYKLWLGACPDTTAITLGLKQTHSSMIRTTAIRAFRRWFRTAECAHIWHSIGGTEGIVTMLAEFSVNHVREFSKQVGRCSNSLPLRGERQGLVTELMYALASHFFPESTRISNPDQRPLLESYTRLVYACTLEGRDAWIDKEGLPKLRLAKAMQTDTEHYQQRCLEKAAAGDKNISIYSELLVSLPPGGCADDPTLPKSTRFATDFLEHLHPRKHETTEDVLKLGGAFVTILRRLAYRNTSDSTVLKVVSLISRCAKDLVAQHLFSYSRSTVKYEAHLTGIARLWGRDPDAFEPLLSGLLSTSKEVDMSMLLRLLPTVSIDRRYRLFSWLLLHQHSIDIESVSKITIPRAIFSLLQKDKARDLLERFAALGQSNTWLDDTRQMPVTVSVDTPLDVLRCHLIDDDDTRFKDALERLGVYKRMAERERDPVVRMEWVNASAVMSVASGSLDTLRDTLLWVRRYNRDPKVVDFYGKGTMLRHPDTVSLLSGIPRIPTKESDLDSIATNIRKGNEIALLLLETVAMCQTEPSFYVYTWIEVQQLFAVIVEDRLDLVKRLQPALALTDAETYKLVWEPTLESLLAAESLGLDERNEAMQYNNTGGPLAAWRHKLEVTNPTLVTSFHRRACKATRHLVAGLQTRCASKRHSSTATVAERFASASSPADRHQGEIT